MSAQCRHAMRPSVCETFNSDLRRCEPKVGAPVTAGLGNVYINFGFSLLISLQGQTGGRARPVMQPIGMDAW